MCGPAKVITSWSNFDACRNLVFPNKSSKVCCTGNIRGFIFTVFISALTSTDGIWKENKSCQVNVCIACLGTTCMVYNAINNLKIPGTLDGTLHPQDLDQNPRKLQPERHQTNHLHYAEILFDHETIELPQFPDYVQASIKIYDYFKKNQHWYSERNECLHI